MNSRPRLLDGCCGAGGAGEGYRRAGWDVVGVDLHLQPRYRGGIFIQRDILDALADRVFMSGFQAVHVSTPCQHYSGMSACRPGLAATYPDLIEPVRELLSETGLPYVLENVVGAPLINPVMLCATMFGQTLLYRHRLFEARGFELTSPEPDHDPAARHLYPASKAGHWTPGTAISVAGHCSPMGLARQVMDIDWMRRDELTEAIPPYYTEYVGRQMLQQLGMPHGAAA